MVFGPKPLDFQQLQHRRPVFLEQFLMLPELACLAELLDVGGHAFADAGNFQQLLGLAEQGRNLVGRGLNRLGGAAIGADTESVVAVDLHQIGGFVEDVRDGFVIQGELSVFR